MAAGARLFDLDGTLWDSFRFYGTVVGRSGTIPETEAIEALTRGVSIVTLLRRAGLPRESVASALTTGQGAVAPFPGIVPVIEGLQERGHRLGVVTSLPGDIALPAIRRLGLTEMFSVVIHAGSGVGAKPSPRPLLAALVLLGVDRSPEDWYVGDTDRDATTADRAAINFAWANWGYGEKPAGARVLLTPDEILGL